MKKKIFSSILPPPNITGNLHIGHALGFTIQDLYVRYYAEKANETFFQPGLDHAGIAGQIAIEKFIKEEKISKSAACKKWKDKCEENILSQLKKLKLLLNWDEIAFTMDVSSCEIVEKIFIKLYEEQLIYRDKKIINWDCSLQTSISDLEVINKEKEGKLYYIKYLIDNNQSITVASTRPETIFGDCAICVHPQDKRWNKYIGKKAIIPIINKKIPIIGDSFSKIEKGSGAVKITPCHDFKDFDFCKKHKIKGINILNKNGDLNENVPEEFRCNRFVAKKKVIEKLKYLNVLLKEEKIIHMLPYSDKTNTLIEPMLSFQWFLDSEKLSKEAIQCIEKKEIQFNCSIWKKNYLNWMKNIKPWCISRQLWWGHQIPVYYTASNNIIVATSLQHANKIAKEKYNESVHRKETDVLDTWFSSSLWPLRCMNWPNLKHYPTDIIVSGFDIIFFWIARMIMLSKFITKKIPFKKIHITPLIVDKNGQKMSKSKGNVSDPMGIIDKYNCEILRLALLSLPSSGNHVKLDEEILIKCKKFFTKVKNAKIFVHLHKSSEKIDVENLTVKENVEMYKKIQKNNEQIHFYMENMETRKAVQQACNFFWNIFCSEYIEKSKKRLNSQCKESKAVIEIFFQKSLAFIKNIKGDV